MWHSGSTAMEIVTEECPRTSSIHLPSAFPPPCPFRRPHCWWPAGLDDNCVLCLEFCPPKLFKNKTECPPFFNFHLHNFQYLWCRKSQTSDNKSYKNHEKWSSGVVLGASGAPLGPQDGPKLKKGWKSDLEDPHLGTKLGAKIKGKSNRDACFDVFVCVFFWG